MAIDIDAIIAAVQAAQLVKDKDMKPTPQAFDSLLSKFVPLLSDSGAARQVLYDASGNPISVVEDKLAIRASELETLLTDIATILSSQSTAKKQDTLAALVGALDAAAVSDPAAAGAVIALLKGLLSRLQTLEGKIDGITDGTTPAKTETQLMGSLIADEEAVPVKRVGREYASNTSSSVDNQEVPAGGVVNYKVDLKGYGHVVSSVVTSKSAPNTNGNYKMINELGSLWGTLVSKDYTTINFTSEPLQILGDKVVFRYQNNSEAPVVLLRLRYYAF